MHRIFISSVQKEFAAERRALKDYIEGDPLLRRFFEVFLFEDLPASDRRADDVYLAEVDRSAIYLGLFGREYGVEDSSGVSPTEREFIHATERAKERLVFIVGADDSNRHPKMQNLIRMADTQVIRVPKDWGRQDVIWSVTANCARFLLTHLLAVMPLWMTSTRSTSGGSWLRRGSANTLSRRTRQRPMSCRI